MYELEWIYEWINAAMYIGVFILDLIVEVIRVAM